MKNLYLLFIALIMFANAQTTLTFEDGTSVDSDDIVGEATQSVVVDRLIPIIKF